MALKIKHTRDIVQEDPDKINNYGVYDRRSCVRQDKDDHDRPSRDEPYLIPSEWNTRHLARRLIDAFKTMDKMPLQRGPKLPGGAWPAYCYELFDLNAQSQISDDEKEARQQERNRSYEAPSNSDISQMEAILDLFLELRKIDSSLTYVLMLSSATIARKKSLKKLCKHKKLAFRTFERNRKKALEMACKYVTETNVPVF